MSPIIVAPFSNSGIRDWPSSHYRSMVALLLDRINPMPSIWITGTPGQRLRANEIVRAFPVAGVTNMCGKLSWSELLGKLSSAACIIGNNSGLAHLGGHFGVPTVCIFGGSHQRYEWRALGHSVMLITRAIGCSPCQLDHGQVSPYDKACLRQIEPQTVADAVVAIMHRVADERAAGAGRMPEAGSGAIGRE